MCQIQLYVYLHLYVQHSQKKKLYDTGHYYQLIYYI